MDNYRDYVTHRGVLYTQAALEWQVGLPLEHQVCLLPDGPLAPARTRNKEIEANDYAEESTVHVTACVEDLLSFLVCKVFAKSVRGAILQLSGSLVEVGSHAAVSAGYMGTLERGAAPRIRGAGFGAPSPAIPTPM
jgi:hypothetical protein